MDTIFSETFDHGYQIQLSKIKTSASAKQIDKFREAAREHETDESVEVFERNLKKIAKAPRSEQSERGTKKDDVEKDGVDHSDSDT